MTKAEAIEYVLNNIENIQDQYDYDYIGVRTQENAFTKGEILENSYVWFDGESTGEELNGTCALMLSDVKQVTGYCGQHVAIIGGFYGEYGQDLGEIIIEEAEVLEVLS